MCVVCAALAGRHLVIIEGDRRSGYGAWCADVRGCCVQAGSLKEVRRRAREAAYDQLLHLQSINYPLPRPKQRTLEEIADLLQGIDTDEQPCWPLSWLNSIMQQLLAKIRIEHELSW